MTNEEKQTACECPTRKALSSAVATCKRLGTRCGTHKPLRNPFCPLCQFDARMEEAEDAISAPCPCAEQRDEALQYRRKNFEAALGFQDRAMRAEAERDSLRAEHEAAGRRWAKTFTENDRLRAELQQTRDEIAQHDLWREEAYRMIAAMRKALKRMVDEHRELGRMCSTHKPLRNPYCPLCQMDARVDEAEDVMESLAAQPQGNAPTKME